MYTVQFVIGNFKIDMLSKAPSPPANTTIHEGLDQYERRIKQNYKLFV